MFDHIKYALALTSAMAVSTTAFAQNVPPNIYTPAPKNNPPETTPEDSKSKEERQRERQEERRAAEQNGKSDLPDSFYKIGELMGMTVNAKGGDKIGVVKNLAINADNGRIRYVMVENGSGTLYPIPMPAMKFAGNRQKAVVDTTTERMKDAPKFNPEGWKTVGDNKWGATVYQFYGISRSPDDGKDSPNFVASSAVVGAKTETRKGDSLGSVKNLMIDTDKNEVAYAVLDFGRDNKLFAVPWQSMTVKDEGKRIVMRGIDRDDLKDAPGFPNSRWPNYKDLGWNKNTNFDSQPSTWVYGMGETKGGNNANGEDYKGWKAGNKYSELFKPNKVDRWRGRIVRVETVTPMNAMDPGTALVIKVEGQGEMVVHLGPEAYIKRQKMKFEKDDEIDVAGSKTELDGKSIIMATHIRKGDENLRLRNAEGRPVWDNTDKQ